MFPTEGSRGITQGSATQIQRRENLRRKKIMEKELSKAGMN